MVWRINTSLIDQHFRITAHSKQSLGTPYRQLTSNFNDFTVRTAPNGSSKCVSSVRKLVARYRAQLYSMIRRRARLYFTRTSPQAISLKDEATRNGSTTAAGRSLPRSYSPVKEVLIDESITFPIGWGWIRNNPRLRFLIDTDQSHALYANLWSMLPRCSCAPPASDQTYCSVLRDEAAQRASRVGPSLRSLMNAVQRWACGSVWMSKFTFCGYSTNKHTRN